MAFSVGRAEQVEFKHPYNIYLSSLNLDSAPTLEFD